MLFCTLRSSSAIIWSLRQGIGKIIVKKLIGEIAEIGGKEILADPDEANVLSIRTLLSNGFVKVKDCDYRYCLK